MKKLTSFQQLVVWQEGHKLVLMVYRVTKVFPGDEKFGLISQMRRCSVSFTSNIAEGFTRETYRDKLRFYSIARASLAELHNQIIVSRDVGYIDQKVYFELVSQLEYTHRVMNGFIKKTKIIIKNSKF